MPVLEIVTFPASEALIQDPSIHEKVLTVLGGADGLYSIHHGLQIEDGKVGNLLVVWETYEHHKKYTERPDYSDSLAELRRVLVPGTLPTVEHVTFEGAYLPALTSPVTEIVHLTPHLNQADEAKMYLGNLIAELEKTPGCYLPFYGKSREHPGKWILVIGWDSVERHWEAIKAPAFQEPIGGLHRTTDLSITHALLREFTP